MHTYICFLPHDSRRSYKLGVPVDGHYRHPDPYRAPDHSGSTGICRNRSSDSPQSRARRYRQEGARVLFVYFSKEEFDGGRRITGVLEVGETYENHDAYLASVPPDKRHPNAIRSTRSRNEYVRRSKWPFVVGRWLETGLEGEFIPFEEIKRLIPETKENIKRSRWIGSWAMDAKSVRRILQALKIPST